MTLQDKQHKKNVIYTEIRFAPEVSMDEGLSASETVEVVLAGLKQAEEDFGIVAKCSSVA